MHVGGFRPTGDPLASHFGLRPLGIEGTASSETLVSVSNVTNILSTVSSGTLPRNPAMDCSVAVAFIRGSLPQRGGRFRRRDAETQRVFV